MDISGKNDSYYNAAAYSKEDIKDKILCNVKLKDAIEKQLQNGMETYVLCITNVLRELGVTSTEWMKYLNVPENERNKNVNIVIEKLGKTAPSECALNITKCIVSTETLYGLMEELDRHHTAIIELGKEGKPNTVKYMRITSEESLHPMRLFTILILLKLITESKISISTLLKVNIQGHMQSIDDSSSNMVKMLISNLKMEGIMSRVSPSQLYKEAGNGIVRSVLMGIFSQLDIAGIRKWNDMSDEEINRMLHYQEITS